MLQLIKDSWPLGNVRSYYRLDTISNEHSPTDLSTGHTVVSIV